MRITWRCAIRRNKCGQHQLTVLYNDQFFTVFRWWKSLSLGFWFSSICLSSFKLKALFKSALKCVAPKWTNVVAVVPYKLALKLLDGLAWLVTIFMLLFIMTEIIAANLFYTIKQLGGFFQVLSTLWSLIATRSSAYTAVNNYSTAESNIYLIVGIVISVIWIAVSIPLLNAASKNSRPSLLLPWLIYNVLI